MPAADHSSLSELERRYERSRARAAERRARRPVRSRRRRLPPWPFAAAVAAALMLGVAAEAQTPAAAPLTARGTASAFPCPIPRDFRPAFRAASRETGVALPLLVAVAYEESQMKPWARSPKGAVGLMQVLPSTARELGADVTTPRGNVRAGALYLARMLLRFGDDLDLALAAYNAGPAAVARAGAIPSPETLTYVMGVKARTELLRGCR